MSANEPDLTNLVKGLSSVRLQPYRSPGGTEQDALTRYEANILLSEALYPSLQMLEVLLRNALEGVLVAEFGAAWYRSPQLAGLMHKNSVPRLEYKQLQKALAGLRKANKQAASGRVVAELSLGFWTGLLGKSYEQVIWHPHSHDLFPYAQPSDRDIKKIRVDLETLRRLRNRVAHHEPIWNDAALHSKYGAAQRLVGWLNADAGRWLGRCDRYDMVHRLVYLPKAAN